MRAPITTKKLTAAQQGRPAYGSFHIFPDCPSISNRDTTPFDVDIHPTDTDNSYHERPLVIDPKTGIVLGSLCNHCCFQYDFHKSMNKYLALINLNPKEIPEINREGALSYLGKGLLS